jgi:uncharacterized alpha-E superfamily protein
MISRVAEHCFWLARYLERMEDTARLLDVNHTLLLDFQVPLEQQWRPLLVICGLHDGPADATADAVQERLTWDPDCPVSIASSLGHARENGRIIREVISADLWERLNYYHLWLKSPAARRAYAASRTDFYAQVKRVNQLLSGICDATMSHTEGWEFIRLGGHLERASQTARILDVKYHMLLPAVEYVGSPVDNAHWAAILTSCSGYEPFHKRPRLAPTDLGVAVAEFLLFDRPFPRSVRHCLGQCQAASAAVSGAAPGMPWTEADAALAELVGWLDERDIAAVVADGLHEGLTRVVDGIHAIGDAVRRSYFEAPVGLPAGQLQSQRQS